MPADLESILKQVFDDGGEEAPPYQPCRESLHAYIEAELAGLDAPKEYPHVKRCLDEYIQFAEEYEEARALFLMERRGDFVDPLIEPTFDLSFLETPPSLSSLWQKIESAGRQASRFLTELHIRITGEVAAFTRLPPLLAPQPVAVQPSRDAGSERDLTQPLQRVTVLAPEGNSALHLTTGPAPAGQAILILQVTGVPGAQPRPRLRVNLLDEEAQLLSSQLTDQAGEVTFQNLVPGRYLLEVKVEDQIWELPVDLMSG